MTHVNKPGPVVADFCLVLEDGRLHPVGKIEVEVDDYNRVSLYGDPNDPSALISITIDRDDVEGWALMMGQEILDSQVSAAYPRGSVLRYGHQHYWRFRMGDLGLMERVCLCGHVSPMGS